MVKGQNGPDLENLDELVALARAVFRGSMAL
jgi:hypothetical protein